MKVPLIGAPVTGGSRANSGSPSSSSPSSSSGRVSTLEAIRARVREAVDVEWCERVRDAQRYLYGVGRGTDGARATGRRAAGGLVVPDYPDLPMLLQEQGVSRRVLDNAFLRLARMQSSDIVPRFPQVSEVVEEARRQFWLARMRGDGLVPGGWANVFDRASFEGDQLGVSYVQFGLRTNPATGRQRVVCRHAGVLSTLRDPEARDPHSASWALFTRHVSASEAERLYGEEGRKATVEGAGVGGRRIARVRVLEYFDLGIGGAGPTAATFLGDVDGFAPPEGHRANPFGCLPYAARVHLDAPGLDHEIGLVERQKATHEELNRIERYINEALNLPPKMLLNVTRIHPEDLKDLNENRAPRYLRAEVDPLADRGIPLAEIMPGAPIDGTIWQRYGQLVQQLTIESGITGADQGIATGVTATESGIVDARSQVAGAWSSRQQGRFYARCVEVALAIAERYDRDPVSVDLFRRNILLNDPRNPALWMDAILAERSTVEIDEQPTTAGGATRQRMEAAGLVDGLLPLLQIGTVDPAFYTERKLRALGFDPKEAMTAAAQGRTDPSSETGMAPGTAPQGNQSSPPPISQAGGRPAAPTLPTPPQVSGPSAPASPSTPGRGAAGVG